MKHSISAISVFLGLVALINPASAQQGASDMVTDWTKADAKVAKGKVETLSIDDEFYNRKRKIWVYTPADYENSPAAARDLVISFDGEDYIKGIPAPMILDNLIAAKKIPSTIQVFVDNSEDRLGDLANRQKFADFVGKELVPWIRKKYRMSPDPTKTFACGYSAGGLAAAYVALRNPAVFGGVLSQSGAFWRGNEGVSDDFEWVTRQFETSAKLNLRFYLVVGGAETVKNASGKSMVETSQHLHQVLRAKGYDAKFIVAPNGTHSPESWRTQLADGLIYLLGGEQKGHDGS